VFFNFSQTVCFKFQLITRFFLIIVVFIIEYG